jgi:hypothetical protein
MSDENKQRALFRYRLEQDQCKREVRCRDDCQTDELSAIREEMSPSSTVMLLRALVRDPDSSSTTTRKLEDESAIQKP